MYYTSTNWCIALYYCIMSYSNSAYTGLVYRALPVHMLLCVIPNSAYTGVLLFIIITTSVGPGADGPGPGMGTLDILYRGSIHVHKHFYKHFLIYHPPPPVYERVG